MFFFFKQKTAYEIVVSDWSSDVCSSDLTLLSFLKGHIGSELPYPKDSGMFSPIV